MSSTANTLSLPPGKSLQPGQSNSIQRVVHGLEYGAIVGGGSAKGVLLADEMGMGKTIVSIVTANALRFRRILVVCPAHIRGTWVNEIRNWQTLDHVILPIDANSQYDPRLLASITSGWVIINYDILERRPELKARSWDLLICDESHVLKNFAARRTCEIFGGRYKGKRIAPIPADKTLLLSGTPFLNRPDELFTQIRNLDPANWPSFRRFFKDYYEDGARADEVRRVTGQPRNLDQLQQQLRRTIMVRELKEVVLDLPEKHYEIRWVRATDLPGALLGYFADMRKQIIITHRKLCKAKSRIERRELRERLNGLLEDVRYEVGVAKWSKVLEYLKGCKSKTLVFAYHHEIIDGLAAGLRKAGHHVVTFTGRTRDSAAIVERFQQDPGCLFFIGNMRAAGIGITLTAASHVVFAELDWTPAVHHQAEDRAHRIGQSQQVEVVYFILDDDFSTDPQIYRLLQSKDSFSRQALNAAVVSELTKSADGTGPR